MRNMTIIFVCALLLSTQPHAQAAFYELAPAAEPFGFVVRVISMEQGGVEQHCSGALVSAWHVLTAAHCVDQALQTSVETVGGERLLVAKYLIAEGWSASDKRYAYDNALLRLASPVVDWRPLERWDEAFLSDSYWSAGYPVHSPEMYSWSGTVDGLSGGVLYQERAGRPGMSGSPLMHAGRVVGVHSHRAGEATGYALVGQELLDRLDADLRGRPTATPPGPFTVFLPLTSA